MVGYRDYLKKYFWKNEGRYIWGCFSFVPAVAKSFYLAVVLTYIWKVFLPVGRKVDFCEGGTFLVPGMSWPWNVPGYVDAVGCSAQAVPDGGISLAGHGDGKGGGGGVPGQWQRLCKLHTRSELVLLCGVTWSKYFPLCRCQKLSIAFQQPRRSGSGPGAAPGRGMPRPSPVRPASVRRPARVRPWPLASFSCLGKKIFSASTSKQHPVEYF